MEQLCTYSNLELRHFISDYDLGCQNPVLLCNLEGNISTSEQGYYKGRIPLIIAVSNR